MDHSYIPAITDDMTHLQLVVQIAMGSALMLVSIMVAGLSLWIVEYVLRRSHAWLTREPHGPKMALVLFSGAMWIMGLITIGVWLWAILFRVLGVFHSLEAAVYFALVSYTTLGYGDVLLPPEWRLLGGMAAANGFMSFGLLIAMMVEALRHVRIGQFEQKRRS